MSSALIKTLIISSAMLLSAPNIAGDINWSGFMSVVGGKTLDSDIQLIDPDGPGPAPASLAEQQIYDAGFFGYNGGVYSPEFSFEQESMIALQGQMIVTNKLRATIQVLARGGNNWEAGTEWAYLSYSLSDEWTINAGRIRLPLYYYSDFLDVGYTYDWVRPPAELYAGPSAINGLSANYSGYWGDVEVNSQVYYGSASYEFQALGTIDTNEIMGGTMTLGIGEFKVRAAYAKIDVDFINLSLQLPFKQSGLAFIYDIADFKFRAELAQSEIGDFDKQNKYMASIAYDFGDFTPYYILASDDEEFLPPSPETEINTVGIAWDFHPGARLKFEYLIEEEVDSGYEVELATAAIDIVF